MYSFIINTFTKYDIIYDINFYCSFSSDSFNSKFMEFFNDIATFRYVEKFMTYSNF